MTQGAVRCPICGAVNPAAAVRCAACWADLPPDRIGRAVLQPKRRRSRLPLAVAAIALGLGLLVWLFLGLLTPAYPRSVRVGLVVVTITERVNRLVVPTDGAARGPDDIAYQTIVLDVVLRNLGDRPRRLDPSNQMALADRDGHLYRALSHWREADLPDTIPANGRVSGHLAFRVPAGTSQLRLVVVMDRVFKPGEIALP